MTTNALQNSRADYSPRKIDKNVIAEVAKSAPPDSPQEILDSGQGLILRRQPTGRLTLYASMGRGKRKKICDASDIIDPMNKLTMTAALKKAKILQGKAAGGHDFKSERQKRLDTPTFTEFLDEHYEPYAVLNQRAGATAVERLRTQFEKRLGKKRLCDIMPADVLKWRTARQKYVNPKTGRKLTPETINRDVLQLKAALSTAVDLGLMEKNPLLGMKLLRVDRNKQKHRALTQEEEKRLRAALTARDDRIREERASANEWRKARGIRPKPSIGLYGDNLTPAVLVSLATGLRRSELFDLKWQQVDFSNTDPKRRVLRVTGEGAKSYQTREIPLGAKTQKVLRNWWMQCGQPKRGRVFTNAGGGRLDSLKKSYYKVLEDAKIKRIGDDGKNIVWHSLRHTFGTRLGANEKDINVVKKLMGHASVVTTERYMHAEKDSLREAIDNVQGVV